MVIAAAFWKPAITGVGMNFTSRGRRTSANSTCIAPAIAIIRNIAYMMTAGSSFGSHSAPTSTSVATDAMTNDTRLRGA